MAELLLHGRPVPTVFDLLGRNENDMTFALAWGMGQSGAFLGDVVEAVAGRRIASADAVINLQRHDQLGGFTDVEVTVPGDLHLIFEAKRGWNLPSDGQLRLYAQRLDQSEAMDRRLVVLTQWGAEAIVASRLGDWELPPILGSHSAGNGWSVWPGGVVDPVPSLSAGSCASSQPTSHRWLTCATSTATRPTSFPSRVARSGAGR